VTAKPLIKPVANDTLVIAYLINLSGKRHVTSPRSDTVGRSLLPSLPSS